MLTSKLQLPGIYIGVRFTPNSAVSLRQWVDENRIPNAVPCHKYHSTVVYSESFFKGYKALGTLCPPIYVAPTNYELALFGPKNDTLVLKIGTDFMHERHHLALSCGARHNNPEFVPHIALATNFEGPIPDVTLPSFPMWINFEYLEELCSNEVTASLPSPQDLFCWFGPTDKVQASLKPILERLLSYGYPSIESRTNAQTDIEVYETTASLRSEAPAFPQIAVHVGRVSDSESYISIKSSYAHPEVAGNIRPLPTSWYQDDEGNRFNSIDYDGPKFPHTKIMHIQRTRLSDAIRRDMRRIITNDSGSHSEPMGVTTKKWEDDLSKAVQRHELLSEPEAQTIAAEACDRCKDLLRHRYSLPGGQVVSNKKTHCDVCEDVDPTWHQRWRAQSAQPRDKSHASVAIMQNDISIALAGSASKRLSKAIDHYEMAVDGFEDVKTQNHPEYTPYEPVKHNMSQGLKHRNRLNRQRGDQQTLVRRMKKALQAPAVEQVQRQSVFNPTPSRNFGLKNQRKQGSATWPE